jgi:hypothetical protein
VFNGGMEHERVARFTAAAERYCGLVEDGGSSKDEQLLLAVAEALAELYAAALRLPDAPLESSDLPETRLSHQAWRDAFFPFAAALNEARRAFEDSDTDWTTRFLFLNDDLGDVYRDMKEGLLLRAAGVDVAEIVWQWRFDFWSDWGEHAVSALKTITDALAYIGGATFEPPTIRR